MNNAIQKKTMVWALVLQAGLLAGAAAGLPATASGDAPAITIAVTGDIGADGAQIVSDLIVAQPQVAAVLLVGDTANASKTPVECYRQIYKNTFDRLLPKLYPCPGNHDRYSSPSFSGYSQFWGATARSPEKYYSFDLGGWHIISMDSVFLPPRALDSAKIPHP